MIYIYHRDHPFISNYLNSTDRLILSWVDTMNLEGYSSLILHRYRLTKGWTKSHSNRYQYKSLSVLKNHLIKEDNIILLHYPDNVEDVYQLLQDPHLSKKDWWLFGLKSNYEFKLDDLGLEYEVVTDLEQYLKSIGKILIRDRKLDQIFNI